MIGTTLNERFRLDHELGRGGMGAVYRATDLILERTVAVKILRELAGDEVGKRLRLEAQILARLLHDHIVRLYDFGVDGSTFYFVMEEVDGSSFVRRWKNLTLPARVEILIEVAEALDYAHHQGVIHRDVKPANVLLTARDQAKLSDFGLSLLIDSDQDAGVVRGTPSYMSPEQARGKRLDFRTDLYSLGVVLYECATGATPFLGTVVKMMAQHVNTDPEPPRNRNPQVSPDLDQLILTLMAKKPERRPGSGREVADRLRSLRDAGLLTGQNALEFPDVTPPDLRSVGRSSSSRVATGSENLPASARDAGTVMIGIAGPDRIVPAPPVSRRQGRLNASSARDMLARVESEPIAISPDERYLCGHYLGYLLGGSRRKGFLGRRPLDPLNADRARLLLAMTYLSLGTEDEEADLQRAARLLEDRPDVRPALSPVIVMKYLASRDQSARRKRFRLLRQQLADASPYASRYLTDEQGVLNPGLMPQVLGDLRRLAPKRDEVDDQLVQRWNRVAEVWREHAEFRESVLRYATRRAFLDPVSKNLWPEVVYPLIERARWQRRLRSRAEAVWDKVAENLHLPDAGVRLDRAFVEAVPAPVVANLECALDEFEEEPSLNAPQPTTEPTQGPAIRAESFVDLDDEHRAAQGSIPLKSADPFRYTLGDLRQLWREAITALRTPTSGQGVRTLPVGPYRLAVVASIRGRAAGQAVLQGIPNKQIEMIFPSFAGSGSSGTALVALWIYQNGSVLITYLDHRKTQRYILWDAHAGVQHNDESESNLALELERLGLEQPAQFDKALSRWFRPQNPD